MLSLFPKKIAQRHKIQKNRKVSVGSPVAALLGRAKGLRAWLPGKFSGPGAHHGEAMDSYYYLLLKIRHGRVVDVLP